MFVSKNIVLRLFRVMLVGLICVLSTSHELTNSKCIETERRALLDLKKDLIDDGNYLSSWMDDDKDCCRWLGVTCSNQTHNVIELGLGSQSSDFLGESDFWRPLRSKSNIYVLKLPYLRRLELGRNNFTTMPKFVSSLRNLRYLDMSYNEMIDPTPYQLENLTKLGHLDLHGNKLTKFPPFIFLLSELEDLDLSENSITGSVPQEIGNLSKLISIDLTHNGEMKINIFEWITNLSSLIELSMENVDFVKATSWLNSIKILPSLKMLSLFGCHFPDPIIHSSKFLHVNASNSIEQVQLVRNTFSNKLLPFLFNISSKLSDFLLQNSEMLNGKIPEYSFYNMTSLEVLDLSDNQLVGGIPSFFSYLCSLRRLDLSNNSLSGPLSPLTTNFSICPQNSSHLRILSLDQNEFEGTLPNLSRFPLLEELDVSHNKLNGVISEVYFLNNSKLWMLDFSMNSLILNIKSDWIPPFQLYSINLRHCEIGPKFPNWLQTQNSLTELDLSNSNISDVLPIWFWSFSSQLEDINISSNSISGKIPNQPFKFESFPVIDLSFNLFHGPLPMFLFNASRLNLSNNKFKGSLSFLCNSKDTLLSSLDLSHNQLYGELPDCWTRFKSLVVLSLENNSFSGKIPMSIGCLDQLETLRFRMNRLSGNLPMSLQSCNNLKVLDLGENKLSGEIRIGKNLTNLIVLRLRSNGFNGSISSNICHLTSIQILDLSLNNISGRIPTCLNNFTAMVQKNTSDKTISSDIFSAGAFDPFVARGTYTDSALVWWKGFEREYGSTLGLLKLIDLSSNQLIGSIPEEITSLLGLITLNLSRNNLVETIPMNIGMLTMLEVLDLSNNQLSGEIPISLADSTTINYLDLSSNNLSGRIPLSTQLQSFNASQYMGNPGLCGLPLPRKCPGDEDPNDVNGSENNIEEEDEGWFDKTWLYAGAGSGFFTGLWVVFGTLLFIRKWRHAYFRVLYDINDWMLLMIALSTARLKRRFSS